MTHSDFDRRRFCSLALATVAASTSAAGAMAQQQRATPRPPPSAADEPATAAAYVAGMQLGTQAANYLEMVYEPAALSNFMSSADFENIRENAGLDHVRIPANCAARANVKGVISEAFLKKLDAQVAWALTRFDRVVLDPLHHYNQWKGGYAYERAYDDYEAVGMLTADEHAVRATAMWTQLAERYKDRSLRLSFDLFNEPGGGPSQGGRPAGLTYRQLNQWHEAVIPAIRATGGKNASRTIWLEPWGNRIDLLTLPANAGPIGVSPHYYSPFGFTHRGDSLRAPSMANFVEDIRYAKRFAEAHKVPVWIGEAGVSVKQGDKPRSPAERAEYTAFVRNVCTAAGLPVCYWAYNSDFAQYDQVAKAWHPGMLQALTARPSPYPVRAVPEFKPLKGGRMAKEYWANGVWRGFSYDPATGVLTTPANDTGADKPLTLVFPDIAVGGGQVWTVRASEFKGEWRIGNTAFRTIADKADQNGAKGVDDRAVNAAGKAMYPHYMPGAPGGFENAYGDLLLPDTFLGVSLILASGSPPGRLVLSYLQSA